MCSFGRHWICWRREGLLDLDLVGAPSPTDGDGGDGCGGAVVGKPSSPARCFTASSLPSPTPPTSWSGSAFVASGGRPALFPPICGVELHVGGGMVPVWYGVAGSSL
ncbi:hypothetical protein E2562_016723 [Oryza meyeriana var. granulata]|uniref:Uncharacterized protein n=1 Tax=Oryza meyeriana var. granulata TaxID=110450 RepID=A0A6G1BWX8_9ORYZ|nr:hypothetical protein E2562_016723 [Oryza meyeriana var. granulata]